MRTSRHFSNRATSGNRTRTSSFAHRVVAEAGTRGLSVWLCPAYLDGRAATKGSSRRSEAGPEALYAYGKFVGERFRDLSNIVWMVGGDYALAPQDRWAAEQLVWGLRDGGAEQLVTAHGGQTSATETYGDTRWLSIDTVYSYKPDLRPELLLARRERPARPFVLIETIYESEHDATPDQIRRQAWQAMLSGAAGQFFGNNPIWHFDGPSRIRSPVTSRRSTRWLARHGAACRLLRRAELVGARAEAECGRWITMASAPGGPTVIYVAGNVQRTLNPRCRCRRWRRLRGSTRHEPLRPIESAGATGAGTRARTLATTAAEPTTGSL